jgi:hypothetical protein
VPAFGVTRHSPMVTEARLAACSYWALLPGINLFRPTVSLGFGPSNGGCLGELLLMDLALSEVLMRFIGLGTFAY